MKRKQTKQNKTSSNKQISSATKLPAINNKKSLSTIPQNLSINTSSYQDEGLITLIQEYMIKNNLFDTLDVFQKDCMKGFKQSAKSIDVLKKQLVQAFDSGNRDLFLTRFMQFVPLSMRTKDMKTLKMQFYLQLYFFIYCIHPLLGKKKSIDTMSKQNFVVYLQGRGSTLAKQQQFLQFYALTYLPKPQQLPTFKSMFTKQWIQDIRKQLILFIDRLYPASKTPTIITMYDKFIQFSLQGQKHSSVAMTQPDQQYYEPAIQEQIQENLQESIMNNPQPVLLQNSNYNKVMNNNSMDKFHGFNQQQQHTNQFTGVGSFGNNNGNNNSNTRAGFATYSNTPNNQNASPNNVRSTHLLTEKQKEQFLQLNQMVNQLEEEKDRLLSFIENSKNKYQNLQNDFKQFSEAIKNILQESQNKWFKIIQELYNVALDLLNAANNLEKGVPLADQQLLQKRGEKLQRYKGFVNMNIEDLLSDNVADYSLFQRPEHDVSVDVVKKNTQFFQKDQRFIEIDFQRVKSILSTSSSQKQMSQQQIKQLMDEKYLILQALRWRMTRIRGAFQKRQIVLSYTVHDILGITQGKEKGTKDTIINVLLDSGEYLILLETALFISALSKDYYGRQYLFDENLMIKMMELRKRPEIDEKIKGIVLVTFQFQSIKRSCQTVMIDNGLIQQLVGKLDKQRDQMSAFFMQYSTALLLNLLLSKRGLDRAERIKSQILMTLINLMQTQNSSVKSYVHAALYPLFARKVFRQKALQFGMEENIKYLLENSPTVQFEHQLRYVYNRLMMEEDQEEEDKDQQHEYDDIDDEEIEDYFHFINQEKNSSFSGEFLLMKKYPLTGPDAMKQMSQIKEQVRATFSKAIYYDREMTQRMSIQTPLLGKGRKSQIQQQQKGFTHNNSVYSNKSSNRILRSQKNSRIKNPNANKTSQKQRLDTVHQNGSQASIKDHRQQSKGEHRSEMMVQTNILQNNSFEKKKYKNQSKIDSVLEMENAESTFRQMGKQEKQQSPLKGSFIQDFDSRPIKINQNAQIIDGNGLIDPNQNEENKELLAERLNQQNAYEASLRNKKLKPYEQSVQYVKAFQTRAMLVRTPPQKPN